MEAVGCGREAICGDLLRIGDRGEGVACGRRYAGTEGGVGAVTAPFRKGRSGEIRADGGNGDGHVVVGFINRRALPAGEGGVGKQNGDGA